MEIEIGESSEDPAYGYPGDKLCYYDAGGWPWYTYFLPAGSDHAFSQRVGVESRHPDAQPLALDGTRDGLLYDEGQQAVFEVGDLFVKIEVPHSDGVGHAESVAAAIATSLSTTQ
ncbi:hypothetical protein ACNI3K_00445 [Demequina sp. SO4-13]|uniref:hypothetical protein n=1 Tax=Demequina sp. SO4-13 TaxID=3401027 RepID=UPI003AF51420